MADSYVVVGGNTPLTVSSSVTSPTGAGFTAGQWNNLTSISLPVGSLWRVFGSVGQTFFALLTSWGASISANSGNTTTGDIQGINFTQGPVGITGGLAGGADLGPVLFDQRAATAALIVFLKVQPVGAVGNNFTGQIVAMA